MKRFVFLVFVILFIGGIAYSQSDKTKKKNNSPQEKVTVNKQYDENGNLIGFDSTYMYSWSSDSTMMGMPDSIDLSNFFNSHHGDFFADDSAFMNDPFHDFGVNPDDFQRFFDQFMGMFPDSLNQNFYSYRNDSTIHFYGDSLQSFHFLGGDDFMPGFEWNSKDSSMMKMFNEPGEFYPNDSIWKQHQELLKKHIQEMEELQEKFFQF